MKDKLLKRDKSADENIKSLIKLIREADESGVMSFSILGGEPFFFLVIFLDCLKNVKKER